MNKQEFANEVAKLVGGEVHEYEKANGIKLVGIVTGSGDIRPSVYIDDYFENGMPVEETADEVKKILRQAFQMPDLDVEIMHDYDRMKEHLTARLYHKSTSADVSKSASEYGFDDLIIIPYLSGIELNTDLTGCVKVNNELVECWGVSEDEILETAIENARKDVSIRHMNSMLSEAFGGDAEPKLERLNDTLVVSNSSRSNGAVSVLFCKDKLQNTFPNGYSVIPSSVHECIIMPYMGNVDFMVQDVNKGLLAPEDVLSDHAYYFNVAE